LPQMPITLAEPFILALCYCVVCGVCILKGQGMEVLSMRSERISGVSSIDMQVSRTSRNWQTPVKGDVRTQVRRANRALEALEVQAKFSVHEGTGQIVVRLEDMETGEVLREIPPEKMLDLVAKMTEMARGIIGEEA